MEQRVPQGPNSVRLIPTYTLVIRFATHLRQEYLNRIFCFYLDNLFLNINVAHTLLTLNIYYIGTTRKNAQGFPE
jgi:Transposase IS4